MNANARNERERERSTEERKTRCRDVSLSKIRLRRFKKMYTTRIKIPKKLWGTTRTFKSFAHPCKLSSLFFVSFVISRLARMSWMGSGSILRPEMIIFVYFSAVWWVWEVVILWEPAREWKMKLFEEGVSFFLVLFFFPQKREPRVRFACSI